MCTEAVKPATSLVNDSFTDTGEEEKGSEGGLTSSAVKEDTVVEEGDTGGKGTFVEGGGGGGGGGRGEAVGEEVTMEKGENESCGGRGVKEKEEEEVEEEREGESGGEGVSGGGEGVLGGESGLEGGGREGVKGGGDREKVKGEGGSGEGLVEGGGSNEEKSVLSDVNLATPTSDLQGLEFFDHNVTSSDSSDIRVRSVKWGLAGEEEAKEGRGGGEGEGERGGSEEEVKSKLSKDRRRETAKLLDLESAVDTRREVSGEELEDDRDLKATITHREKQGTRADSYINYRIVTETTRPSHLYEESHYEVWRRYRDFEWLRHQVERSYPTLILPPLPGKQVARYFDHMCEAFLEERQRALEKFIWRLTVHPYFSFSTDLKSFLTATPEVFAGYVQESQSRQKLMDKLSSSVKNAQMALMLKDVDPEFSKQSTYFSELCDKMSVLERIGARLHSERESLQMAQDDFSVSLFHWAANEQVLTNPLQKLASCVEHCGHSLKRLNDANTYSMMVAVKEYQLYSNSAVAAIRRRDALQLEEERSGMDRVKKKRHHDEATASGKVQRVIKLADDLEKVGLAAEKAHDQLSQANEQLRVDIEKWHEAKNREVCQFMRQFAANHMEYHQKCFSEWESALRQLRGTSPSPAAAHEMLLETTSSSHDSDETPSDT